MPTLFHNHKLEFSSLLPGSGPVRELAFSTAIREFAASAVMLFEPVFLYTRGLSLAGVISFYLVSYLVYLFLVPLGGKFIRAHGYEHGILYSTPFLIGYYFSLYAFGWTPWALLAAVVMNGLFKMLFYSAFHADFARFGSARGSQGRELSAFSTLATVANVLGPLFGGLVITRWGYPVLFGIVALLLMAANIPLLLTPEQFEPRTLSYPDAWRRLVRPENRARLLTFFGYGGELITLLIWPLYLFIAVPEYLTLGAIGSAATAIVALVTIVVGRLADHRGRHRMLRYGATFTFASWLVRIAASATPVGVFAAHAFARAAEQSVGIPLIALTYEYARGYSVTKTAVFLEMAIVAGKIISALVCLALVLLFPPGWMAIFAVGALFSLFFFFGTVGFPKSSSA